MRRNTQNHHKKDEKRVKVENLMYKYFEFYKYIDSIAKQIRETQQSIKDIYDANGSIIYDDMPKSKSVSSTVENKVIKIDIIINKLNERIEYLEKHLEKTNKINSAIDNCIIVELTPTEELFFIERYKNNNLWKDILPNMEARYKADVNRSLVRKITEAIEIYL